MTGVERLQEHFNRFKKEGLFYMKFAVSDDMSGATVENVSSELADMFDAIERGDCVPMKQNDSQRIRCKFDASDLMTYGMVCRCHKCSPR